jgi:imidazolonepropionase-like amidohydrolase
MKKVLRSLCVLCALALLYAGPPSLIAIRNVRVVTVSGPVIEKGSVLLKDGLIEAVGADVKIPPAAWVIDGERLTVYPGLIDGLSTVGMPEKAPDAASWLRAADQLNPADARIEKERGWGFTSAAVFPTKGIFAGQGAVVNLGGAKAGEMIVAARAGEYATLTTSGSFTLFPHSLMGVMAYIRQVYLDAGHYRLAQARYARTPSGTPRPEYDRVLEGVLESPRVLLPASRAVELDRMIRFAQGLKQPTVLYGGQEAYAAADLVKKAGVPLLVSLKWPERPKDSDPDQVDSMRTLEFREKAPSSPAALAKAGAKFALYTDGLKNGREWKKAIKRALDAGLAPSDAVRAMTLSAAEIYGVADRLGSIDKGKIANLVVTDGELFREKTQVKYLFIDGVKYEPVPETAEEKAAQ